MIGNNLKKDIAGANRYGITSVWLDWSPRYFHTVEEPDEKPDYTAKTPEGLRELIHSLERELERTETARKLELVTNAFTGILYEEDETFLENMKSHNLAGDDIEKYRYWEWTQGVGLFGLWKMFCHEKEKAETAEKYLTILRNYYDRQLTIGFPALNVNTVTPYLTMSFLAEYTGEEKYMEPCKKAAGKIMKSFPRTMEGGFQHKTSDSLNEQELWDDTLYMTVLFLANMGRILKDQEMIQEAQYQFLLHEKYLSDPVTGLWYHGWTFLERNHFAGAFWGRGNCWITMAIPEFLAIVPEDGPVRRELTQSLRRQAESLKKYQSENGMWHTLVDDKTSYVEASATCGFAYGILKAVREGLLDPSYRDVAMRALPAILNCISEEGVVNQVSYGTPVGRPVKNFDKEIEL
ncbi:MAG: glycoside hydrolase family 88 protein, partial [Lachnospiraceae bacterium]|nr:glycoside hydrolase family 88 protein [Lachnospiraceae bacterium]